MRSQELKLTVKKDRLRRIDPSECEKATVDMLYNGVNEKRLEKVVEFYTK